MDGSKAGTAHVGGLGDDGHYTPDIKEHSLRKIRLHNHYVSVFSTAMKDKWPQRAYLALYSGPGRARVAGTGEVIATSAMSAMPTYGRAKGLLSFCFVDPFSARLNFGVFRALGSRYKMDFLVLLMLGRDVRTNFKRYFQDETNTRIADLISDEGWRDEWVANRLQPKDLIRFVP